MKLVSLSDIFKIERGSNLDLNALEELSSGTPYVSCTASNNGVLARVTPVAGVAPLPAGVLSLALVGNAMAAFIQDAPFYSAQNIAVLTPLEPMCRDVMLFYACCLRANQYRFSYGRKANRTVKLLRVPALSAVPTWVGGGPIGQPGSLWHDLSTSQCRLAPASAEPLDTKDWQQFRYDELFDIRKGKRLTSEDMTIGNTAFIGATEYGNGETGRIGQEALHPGGQITVSYDGSIAEAFYQPEPFWASDSVNVFYPRFEMSREAALFLVTLIRREKYRYNYGRKWKLEVMKASILQLPVTPEDEPDVAAMEAIVRNLPAWKLLEQFDASITREVISEAA